MKLTIFPIGGMGNVTKNMFLYEYDNEILIVDCGIGFPERYMLGVDILIPDVTHLLERLKSGAKIVGIMLTHGHDDHIAALPYVLPQIEEVYTEQFPIVGSPLTAAFAQARMKDRGYMGETEVLEPGKTRKFGTHFSVESIHVTHSIPNTTHLAIETPEGLIYHGSDFKLDPDPVDGRLTDLKRIEEVGRRGVLCAMVDCLRIERTGISKSESTVSNGLRDSIAGWKGRVFVTLMSSNLHRVQQVIDIAEEERRKITFVGRSVEQNVEVAEQLRLLHIPKGMKVPKKQISQYKENEILIVVAGSQGQPGSSMVRMIAGEHPVVSIKKSDLVVFSSEPIPGNEDNVYGAIDSLSRDWVPVAYPDIQSNLHVSGHATSDDQMKIMGLLKPRYILPIGGADRHRVQFARVAIDNGFQDEQILVPRSGQAIEFQAGRVELSKAIQLKELMIDGLGVGDVGEVVLSDRKTMAEEGMVVVILPRTKDGWAFEDLQIISRGVVFMRHADEFIEGMKQEVVRAVKREKRVSDGQLMKELERTVGRYVREQLERSPLVLASIVEV